MLRLTPLEDRLTPVAGYTVFGAAPGGQPLVGVFSPALQTISQFAAFESSFTGGVRATAAELDGDPNTQDVIVVPGPGGGAVVKVYSVDVRNGLVTPRTSFFAFEPSYRGGLRVAAGNVLNRADGQPQIVIGAGEGGGPRVRVFNRDGSVPTDNSPLVDFFAYEPTFRGGVQVAAGELDGNTATGDELVVAAGPGGGPRIRVFRTDGAVLADYFAFSGSFRGGANVTIQGATGATGRVVADAYALDPSQRSVALNTAAGATGFAATTSVTTGTTLPATTAGIGGNTTAAGTTAATTSGIGGSTTAGGLTGSTTAANPLTAGGITAATGATGLTTTITGLTTTAGLGGSTTAGGLTGATAAGGVTAASTATGVSTTLGTNPLPRVSVFAFGPFGDPGPALATPVLFTLLPFVPGITRYTIPV